MALKDKLVNLEDLKVVGDAVGDLKTATDSSVLNEIIKDVNETNLIYADGAFTNIISLKAQQDSNYSSEITYTGFGFNPIDTGAPYTGANYWFSPPFVSGSKYKLYFHYYGDWYSGATVYSNIRVYRGTTLVENKNFFAQGDKVDSFEFTSDGTEKIRIYLYDKSVFKLFSAVAVKVVDTLSSKMQGLLSTAIGTNLKYGGHITSANYNTLIADLNNAPVDTFYTCFTGDASKLPSNVPVSTTFPFVIKTYGTNGYIVFQELTYFSNSTSLVTNQLSGSTWRRVLTGTPGSRSVFYNWISADETQNTHIRAIENQMRPVVTVDKNATADEANLLYTNWYKAMKYAYNNNCDVYVKAGTYDIVAEYIAVEGQAVYDAINNAWKGTPIGHGMTVKCAAEAYFTMKNTSSTSANYLTIGQWLAPLLPLDGGFRLEGWNIDAKNTRCVVHDGGYNNSDVFCNHEFINCQMKLDNTDFAGQSGLQMYSQCIGGGLLSGGIHVIVKDCIFESENFADNAGIVSYHNVSDTTENATSYNTYDVSGCYCRMGTVRCTYHGTETPVSPFKVHDNFLRSAPIIGAEVVGTDTTVNMELLAWNNTIQASN